MEDNKEMMNEKINNETVEKEEIIEKEEAVVNDEAENISDEAKYIKYIIN